MNNNNLKHIISNLLEREENLFFPDFNSNYLHLNDELKNSNVLVIGGAGTIGSNFIKQILKFPIKKLVVIDFNENALAELVRDIRSSNYTQLPEILTYPISFGSDLFHQFIHSVPPFQVVANFAAIKHVRSEKDPFAILRMIDNNIVYNYSLLETLNKKRPTHFFAVSTDKAANPVNFMGASKRLMEEVIFSYEQSLKVSSARFANVAFSNGSLLESYFYRYYKNQTLVCPKGIKRYFVSPEESGTLCLLATILGKKSQIFFPKLNPSKLVDISVSLFFFLEECGLSPYFCESEEEAKSIAKDITSLKKEGKYPVLMQETNTTGEKPYEEFHSSSEDIKLDKLQQIGLINFTKNPSFDVNLFLKKLKNLKKEIPSKEQLKKLIDTVVLNFQHEEKGFYLDQKM